MCVMQGPCEVVGPSYWALLGYCISLNAPLGLSHPSSPRALQLTSLEFSVFVDSVNNS